MTIKDKILRVMNGMPDDATIDDAIYRLEFLRSIEQGLDESKQGLGVDHDELFDKLLNEHAESKTDLEADGHKKSPGNKRAHSQRRAKNSRKLHKTA